MIKTIVLYPIPENKRHFVEYYRDIHLPLFKKMPGVSRAQFSFDPETVLGSSEFFCVFEVEFVDEEHMERAMTSKAGQATNADIPNYSPNPPLVLRLRPTEV